MILDLLGLYLDGTDWARGVPRNPARQLRMQLGASCTVRLRVINPGGAPVNLTGSTLKLSLRRQFAWPGQFTSSALAAKAALACPCGKSGCRGCSSPVYGSDDVEAATAAADLVISGTLIATEGVNRANFVFAPADTKLLTPGRYGYDVWLTQAGGARDSLVPMSPFILEPVATFPS